MSPRVLGILNITPDSFSDGGQFLDPDEAIGHAKTMVADGVDIIDVGGESTRPGSDSVTLDEELRRVIPVIEAVAGTIRVSIDTRRESVARAAVAAGATIINDVSASLWPVAADLGVGWIAVHMRGQPSTMQETPHYDDVVEEVFRFLDDRATSAHDAGISEIWVDPGFGFGKNLRHNLALLANLDQLVGIGWPVAVGTSRKSMLGQLLARSDGAKVSVPANDRLVGSVVTATYAMACGADLIRVHDVKETRQAATIIAGATHPRRT